jgi:nicotinate-nucleotide adenylyltransferase
MAERVGSKIGLFGGSFDPPHLGHVIAVIYTLSTQPIDQILVIPCYRHAFLKSLTPFKFRYEMCKLAFRDIHRVRVSRVEEEIKSEGYTVRTIEYLKRTMSEAYFTLIVGADVILEFKNWARFEEIKKMVKIMVLGRQGIESKGFVSSPPLFNISSSEVRDRIAKGETVSQLVPRLVLDYIQRHQLYR